MLHTLQIRKILHSHSLFVSDIINSIYLEIFMAGKIQKVTREVNGITVEQRSTDGFINATAMCVANDKDISDWLKTDETWSLVSALAESLAIISKYPKSGNSIYKRVSASYPTIVVVKRGSPESGGGTWLHPDLAIQLAQWLDPTFALQVSRWVREWMTSAYNPIQLEADADRVQIRDDLKDSKRLEFTDQIKVFLQAAGSYSPGSFKTNQAFWTAHDKLNQLLTTETAKEMRVRLGEEIGKEITEQQLLRDYFPIKDLANYASLCQAAANEMSLNGTFPLIAIDIAARQVLSPSYVAKPIDFTERINLVRRRLEQKDQIPLLPEN